MVTVSRHCQRGSLLQFMRQSQPVVEVPGELVRAQFEEQLFDH